MAYRGDLGGPQLIHIPRDARDLMLGLQAVHLGSILPIPRGITHDGDLPLLSGRGRWPSRRGVTLTIGSVVFRQLLVVDERLELVVVAQLGNH